MTRRIGRMVITEQEHQLLAGQSPGFTFPVRRKLDQAPLEGTRYIKAPDNPRAAVLVRWRPGRPGHGDIVPRPARDGGKGRVYAGSIEQECVWYGRSGVVALCEPTRCDDGKVTYAYDLPADERKRQSWRQGLACSNGDTRRWASIENMDIVSPPASDDAADMWLADLTQVGDDFFDREWPLPRGYFAVYRTRAEEPVHAYWSFTMRLIVMPEFVAASTAVRSGRRKVADSGHVAEQR